MEATNSPITAPTGAKVTASLMPAQMLASALGNWIFCRTCRSARPHRAHHQELLGVGRLEPRYRIHDHRKEGEGHDEEHLALQAEPEPNEE